MSKLQNLEAVELADWRTILDWLSTGKDKDTMSKLQNLEAVKDLLKPYLGQYLSMQGVKYTQGHNFVCIDPSHSDWDGDGGSMGLVRGNMNIMHCFGCLDVNELIWTEDGLRPIGFVQVGERVVDRFGELQGVTATERKRKPLLALETGAFRHDPLLLTPDHTCLFVKQDEAILRLPFLYRQEDRGIRFKSALKDRTRCYRSNPKTPVVVTEGPTSEVELGDFFLFPVIGSSDRDRTSLQFEVEDYSSGPIVDRITELPVNEEAAYLYGLWLAEGHANDRTAFFTFNLDEKDTYASEVVRILADQFDVPASVYLYPEKQNCVVGCSKVDLVEGLKTWFGNGAKGKRIPTFAMYWEKSIQLALLQGYFDGDGSDLGYAKTVSQELAYGIFALSIQAEQGTTLGFDAAYVDSKGQAHSEYWTLYRTQRESLNGFFEKVAGVNYFWSRVSKIAQHSEDADVVDISVENTESFVTKLGMVHNCGIRGDIFLAAHLLENKPMTGKAFVIENLKYLADTFGIEMPEIQLSEEDLYEMQVKAAYAHAASIMTSSDLSDAVQAKLADMEWSVDTRSKLGIGSVTNFSTYMDRMVKQYGHPVKFLQSVDLANDKLFSQNNLIFTVCDELGSPLGFAARKLNYETDTQAFLERAIAIKARGDMTDEQKAAALQENLKTKVSKYTNTSAHNPFYQKIRRLFGFHIAKKAVPPLFIMEGYPDCATAQDRGMKNVCAIGATAFTKEHVDVILDCGIKHLIFVLDGDSEGYKATDRAIKVIEEAVGDRIGLKVELIQMPEGTDDPDRYIRLYGVDEFQKLPRLDIFSWKVKRQMQAGSDPIMLANEAVPLIVNEPNYLLRLAQIQKLAQVTGVDEEWLRSEVRRRVDQNDGKAREEMALITTRMISDIKRSPDSVMETMRQTMAQIEVIQKGKDGYNPQNVLSAYTYVFDKQSAHVTDIEIRTGFPIYDKKLGGLPKGAAFISVPGKPNQGKTSLQSNLAWRIPDNNPDTITIFHTVDDALDKAIPRILGSKYHLPSKLWRKKGYYTGSHAGREEVAEKWPHFPEIYAESQAWLQHQINEERLIIADINLLAGSLPALEGWLKSIRKRFPNDAIVCMGDNFALYQLGRASCR